MQPKIKTFLFKEFYITEKLKLRAIDLIAYFLITFFCFAIRVSMFHYASGDYNTFLDGWFTMLKDNGGFAALSMSLGDYTPPYFYILASLTYLPIDSLISIKLVSCLFDLILSITVMRIVYLKYRSVPISILASSVTLLAPTVLLNSAVWAQCDVIFTTFLVLCIFAFLKDKPIFAALFFGIAICFKLQAIFLAPLLLILWLKRRMKFWQFFIIPAMYIVCILPSFFAGRNFYELLTIYLFQSGQYKRLSLNAPNLYICIGNTQDEKLAMAAIIICFAAVLIASCIFIFKKYELTNEIIVSMALFYSILLPYLLPHMHERYFYLADVLAIIYAFYRPKRFFVPIMVIFSSLCAYLPFLYGQKPIPLNIAAVIMFFSLIIVTTDLIKQIFIKNKKNI